MKLATSRTVALAGDVSGSAGFDGTSNITITATVADDSHNHTIANVDSLQTTLDAKYQSGSNVSLGTIASGAITITNATNAGGTARNVYQSTSAPTGGAGAVGVSDAIFVGDVNNAGTMGDMFGAGPTQLNENDACHLL